MRVFSAGVFGRASLHPVHLDAAEDFAAVWVKFACSRRNLPLQSDAASLTTTEASIIRLNHTPPTKLKFHQQRRLVFA